jgi:uncharacterized membrane protein YcjF (UPF0283 family)
MDVIFAYIVGTLAGLAVIGALVVVIVAEVYTLRRTVRNHRLLDQGQQAAARWWRERGATVPTIPRRGKWS